MANPRSLGALVTDPDARHPLAAPEATAPAKAPATARRGRRGKGARRPRGWVLPLSAVAGVLALLQLLTASGLLGRHFPTVVAVAQSLAEQIGTQVFWDRVVETLTAWAAGFLIAAVLAVPAGLVIAANRLVFRSTRLLIDFLRPIPPVAVLPLAVLLMGTGTEMKIYLVAFSAVFPILFQTMYGVQDVDPVTRDTTRAYGLSNWQQYRHVVLPSATPYIATGLRLAATIALVVTVATELIVGSSGLGYGINQVRYADDVPAMYALIFVTGLIGWLITIGFSALEKRVLHWHHSHRETNL